MPPFDTTTQPPRDLELCAAEAVLAEAPALRGFSAAAAMGASGDYSRPRDLVGAAAIAPLPALDRRVAS
jgi:hypothetical protein